MLIRRLTAISSSPRCLPKMRTLYLMRHAHPESTSATGRDYDRPLSPLGREQIRTATAWLAKRPAPQLIVASPAMRTRQTAELLKLGVGKEYVDRLYDNRPEYLRSALLGIDDAITSVLVIGHNPSLGLFLDELRDVASSAASEQFLAQGVRPGTIARLEFDFSWVEFADERRGCCRFVDGFQ